MVDQPEPPISDAFTKALPVQKKFQGCKVINKEPEMKKRTINKLDAPAGLSDEMKLFWNEIVASYDLSSDPAGLKMLKTAVEAGDRVREARAIISREGLVIPDRFGQSKPHPAVAIERDFRTQFLRALRELAIDPPTDDPRPPRSLR